MVNMARTTIFHLALLALHSVLWLPLALSQELPDTMTVGTDEPADEAVKGFHINHAGLNVRNLTASMHFYGKVLGMRHIITIHFTPNYSLTYMGFAQGGRNGTGFQTGAELLRDKNNVDGQIKLFYFPDSELQDEDSGFVASTKRTNTFANLGLVVPDVKNAQDRFEQFGVKIIKRVGEVTVPADGAVANATNLGPASTSNLTEVDAVMQGLLTTDFEDMLFVEDPDGNMLEIVKQNGF